MLGAITQMRPAACGRPSRARRRLGAVALVLAALLVTAGWAAGPARAQSTATSVTVSVSPTLVATGQTTTATATVTGPFGPVSGDNVQFTYSDPANAQTTINASPVSGSAGQYTATINVDSVEGNSQVTATDTSTVTPLQSSNTATFTQYGTASQITLSAFSPSSIVGDGGSTATATASVTDASGDPVPAQSLTVSSSDPGQRTPAPLDQGDGTYRVTVASSLTPETAHITVADGPVRSNSQPLTQTLRAAATIAVALAPASLTADGSSTATATITLKDAQGRPLEDDAGALRLSADDPNVSTGAATPAASGVYTVPVRASTTAHPVHVTVSESRSGIQAATTLALVHGPARTVRLQLTPAVLHADGISKSAVLISVNDANGNTVAGDAITLTASHAQVAVSRVHDAGDGTYTASITSSNIPITLALTATDTSSPYRPSARATMTETPAPSLLSLATMQWSFLYTPHFTVLRSLMVSGAPVGAEVVLICRGHGCPFVRRVKQVTKQRQCRANRRPHCLPVGSYSLARPFHRHPLGLGSRLVVEIVRPGYIGKYYSFKVRRGRAPRVVITCLAPGGSQPGLGCR